MTREDTARLFVLLRELYPNTDAFKRDTAAAAWYVILRPFGYEAVKAAIIERARSGTKFPPDISEVAQLLEAETPERPRHTVSLEIFRRNCESLAHVMGVELPDLKTEDELKDWARTVRSHGEA